MPSHDLLSHTGGMGQGKHEVTSQERRVKRFAIRYGLHLMKAQKPFGKVLQHGGYMLRDEDTRKIIFGDKNYEFSATLDEIEEFLEANTKPADDA